MYQCLSGSLILFDSSYPSYVANISQDGRLAVRVSRLAYSLTHFQSTDPTQMGSSLQAILNPLTTAASSHSSGYERQVLEGQPSPMFEDDTLSSLLLLLSSRSTHKAFCLTTLSAFSPFPRPPWALTPWWLLADSAKMATAGVDRKEIRTFCSFGFKTYIRGYVCTSISRVPVNSSSYIRQ